MTTGALTRRAWNRQIHRLSETRERVASVWDAHGPYEMFLEPRLDCRLQFLHSAHDRLDLGASGTVKQRDARTGAGRVAGTGDAGRVAVGDQAEDHRVERVDVRSERSGETDPVDGLDAQGIHEQAAPRV